MIVRHKMASGKFNWTVTTTKQLISQYEANEMLYDVKNIDYKNRNKRLTVYTSIAEIISNISEFCTASDVRKEINGLRCQYLAEKLKVRRVINML